MVALGVHDDDAAAILAPGRSHLVYRDLKSLVGRIGSQLRAAGISCDDRVVLIAPNGPEAATAFLSIASACQCAPLNPGYRDAELAYYLRELRPKLIIHAADRPPEVAERMGIWTTHMRVDASAPAGVFALPDLPPANGAVTDAATTALLLYTSGTSSRPRLVPLTWHNLNENASNVSTNLQLTAADRCLNVMPLFHISGLLTSLLSTLQTGGSVVCAPGLIAPRFFDWLDEFEPTWYSAVPTMHQSILARAPRHPDSVRRSRLRFARSASSVLPLAVAGELETTFRAPVVNTYGLTESAGQLSTTGLNPAARKPGSVGRAVGAEIAVLDARGERVVAAAEGHVCIRGATVMSGYVENEAANQESFRNGWFYTGDLGRMDEDGDLFLTGRVKEILNRGGEKISGQEVDEVLMEHPAVQQCLTFALPDSVLGDEVGVVVVRRAGAELEEAELQNFAACRLADFKVPRRVFFCDDIPKTSTGKLQRLGLAGRLGIATDAWKPAPATSESVNADLTSAVARTIASVLHVPQIGPDVSFFDAGGDSLVAARLLVRLEREFGRTVTMIDLFSSSSASAIAAKLATKSAAVAARPSARPADGPPKLSAGQVRLWLHDRDNESLAAHTMRLFEIRSEVDSNRIRQAFLRILARHEPLRTVIDNDGGAPRPRLRAVEPFPWPVYDWTATPPERRESSARELCRREAVRPFKLDSDLMLRTSLHNLGDGQWWLLVVIHHIATDGWSGQLLRHELQTALDGGVLPTLLASYSDFARWQESELSGDRRAAFTTYWTARLDGAPPLLELPLEFSRPTLQGYQGRAVTSVMPPSLRSRLLELSRQRGATLFMTLLAGWTCLLSRYTASTDICVGSPLAGRNKAEFENLVGLFMNTLVLRTKLEGDPTFVDALDRVRETCLNAWDHDLPFEYLLEALPPERNVAYSPYYQVHFQLRNFPRAAASATMPLTELDLEFEVATTDLNVEITDGAEGLSCRLIYNTALFTERFARAMLGHFEVLLRGAADAPDTRLSRLPIMTAEERETLVSRRLPPQPPRADATVVEMFERQAAERTDEVAIRFRDRRLTYGELNQQANRLAALLATAGVVPEQVVALCIERSPEWIVAMLAVAKAGGAYMSLDPHHPPALVRDLIGRSRAAIVLADDGCRDTLHDVGVPVIWTGAWPSLVPNGDATNPPLAALPQHLAHVFFTSGSSGRSKGVATEHRNLSAFLAAYHWMPYSPSETYLQFTSLTFDPAAAEVWGPLTHGGCCAVYAEGLDDPSHLAQWIRETGVTTCYLSASVFNTLIDEAPEVLRPVKRILIGGEALSVPHVRRAFDLLPRTELINGYGPTEATVYYTGYRIPRPFDPARASVPIGRPLDSGCAYVMDQSGQLVPDGLPGELWIGGDTVARGYLHEPELTAAAFVADPIARRAGARLYRTGDRARWLPDGQLEFLGRSDHQIKVRGVRIELGEIESVLREHPAVRHAVVVATLHPVAGNLLTAFVEQQDGAHSTAMQLRAFLAGRLPHQMVPARMQIRAALPMTASGKIDRRALKESAALQHDGDPATTPAPSPPVIPNRAAVFSPDVQSELADIWKDLLGVQHVAVGDDFFDLGGHSLLAARLAFQIERQFGQRVTLASLFEAATLSRMAALIRKPGASRPALPATPAVSPLPPMLCVAAGPFFRPFAEALSPRCQFHSVPTPAGDDAATMEELAARILSSIHESHPHGPLILAGWSLAGVVAIEVAAQLERAGTEVRAVILFDTLSPVRHRQWFESSPRLRQWQLNFVRVRYHVEEAMTRGPAGSLRYLMTTAHDARARKHYDRMLREAAAGSNGPFDVPLDFREAFGLHAARYTPAPLRARLVVVRPERQKKIGLLAGDLGWSELGYQVELIIVPGDHERMFAARNAPALAERLLAKLEE